MHIQLHWTGAQLKGREEVSPALFENWKDSPEFWKKGPDCDHLWVKFSIQNIVLRECRREIFSGGASFSCFFWRNVYRSALVPHTHSPFLFAKHSILNFWQCSEYVSVSITAQEFVQWPYGMYHALDTFRILAHSALCFFRYMKAYSIIFSIRAYSRIFRHY